MTFTFSTPALFWALFIGLCLLAVYLLRRDFKRSGASFEYITGVVQSTPRNSEPTPESDQDTDLPAFLNHRSTATTEKHKPCPCGDDDGRHCSLDGCPYPPAVKHQSPRKPRAKKPQPAGKKPAKAAKPAAKAKPRAATPKKPITKPAKKKAAKK